jgi:predicted N-acetyltransferase YhbS
MKGWFMAVTRRSYQGPADFAQVGEFLVRHYQPGNRDGNWFQPIWEYAYFHSYFDKSSQDRIGIWEDEGQIVAVATYESRLGEAFFNTHPKYEHLKPEMLMYTEQHLTGIGDDGARYLMAFVNDFDSTFEEVVKSRGYRLEPWHHRPMSRFEIPSPFPPIGLPEGFHVKSLAEDNDLRKIHRALHRGFNHPGEPPEDGLEDRGKMQEAPHFRKDLTIVVEAPSGDFVSYAGMWYDADNRFGYVEPVATDPDYRRMGLGKAAVLESIRRCGEQGATVAYVGSDLPFYQAIGFKKLFSLNCWLKRFVDGGEDG